MRKGFYERKHDLYATVEQKLSEAIFTLRSIQQLEIDAPGVDVDELKELNRTAAELSNLRLEACSMMDALHPMLDWEDP